MADWVPVYPNEMSLRGRALNDHQVLWDRAANAVARAIVAKVEAMSDPYAVELGEKLVDGWLEIKAEDWLQLKRDLGLQ